MDEGEDPWLRHLRWRAATWRAMRVIVNVVAIASLAWFVIMLVG